MSRLVRIKKKDRELWQYVCETLHTYADNFDLKLKKVRPLKEKWLGLYVGSCSKRGILRFSVRDAEGELLEAYSLIDLMAHELAHLRHQKHSSKWFELHFHILDLMRVSGVYRDLREILGKKTV
jgi:predicted metal-dependent hydrolase